MYVEKGFQSECGYINHLIEMAWHNGNEPLIIDYYTDTSRRDDDYQLLLDALTQSGVTNG